MWVGWGRAPPSYGRTTCGARLTRGQGGARLTQGRCLHPPHVAAVPPLNSRGGQVGTAPLPVGHGGARPKTAPIRRGAGRKRSAPGRPPRRGCGSPTSRGAAGGRRRAPPRRHAAAAWRRARCQRRAARPAWRRRCLPPPLSEPPRPATGSSTAGDCLYPHGAPRHPPIPGPGPRIPTGTERARADWPRQPLSSRPDKGGHSRCSTPSPSPPAHPTERVHRKRRASEGEGRHASQVRCPPGAEGGGRGHP